MNGMLQIEPMADGYWAIFANRNIFVGWVLEEPTPEWDTGQVGLWIYETTKGWWGYERFSTKEDAAQSVYKSYCAIKREEELLANERRMSPMSKYLEWDD